MMPPSGGNRLRASVPALTISNGMKTILTTALILLGAAGPDLTAQSKPARNTHTRQVFVAVTDRSGAPVLDLGPADSEGTRRLPGCLTTAA